MSRSDALRTAPSLALAAAFALPLITSNVVADEPEILRLRAFAIDLNSSVRANTIDIVIERWSRPEETANLKSVLVEKNTLEIENYRREPVRLNEVTLIEPKQKK